MAPILGIWASQNYARYSITGSYESIATASVGSGGTATIDFNSIPSTYTHLQIRAIGRTGNANTVDNIRLRINGNTTSVYAWHGIYGDGSTVGVNVDAPRGPGVVFTATGANSTASIFATGVIDILDYADTNKFKTVRFLHGNDQNGSGTITFGSNLWRSTSAITRLELYGDSSFVQYSHFALYGIKGA